MKNAERMFACIFAPAMPLQAMVRTEPDLRELPLAAADGDRGGSRITHISASAGRLGVKVGMTASQARSIAADVVVRQPAAGVVAAAVRALTDIACAFSATVQVESDGRILFEAAGHEAIHGSFLEMGQRIINAAGNDGFIVRVGFGCGIRLAGIASRCGAATTVLETGAVAGVIAGMPVSILEPSPAMLEALTRLRVITVGDLAALPARGIGSRLGSEGTRLHALASGIDESVITKPVVPDDRFIECVKLDWTLDNLEPLIFLIKGAADRISARMQMRGLVPGKAGLTLDLENSGIHFLETAAGGISSSSSTISSVLHRVLSRNPPSSPICGFTLSITASRPRAVQCQLFGPPVIEPSRVRDLTGRLAAIVGEGNVGSPDPDARPARPEYAPVPFDPCPSDARHTRPVRRPGSPAMAFRRFNPPYKATVATGNDLPAESSSNLVSGRLCRVAGPWYLDASWWGDGPVAGALYDIEIPGRGVFRLWHDLLDDGWLIDGVWD